MDDSVAQARVGSTAWELPAWKSMLGSVAAIVLGLLFIVSGVWKLMEPLDWAARAIQARIPTPLGLPAAVFFGVAETWGGMMLMVPRFRRWGAWVTGLLLVGFIGWFAFYYAELTGADCSCFPWLKRTVGPVFFIGDGIMLLLAVMAGVWARPSESRRGAGIALGAIAVFALASVGISYARQTGAPAPEAITVNGQPYSLAVGRNFIYFFDPECSHCYQAAKTMAGYNWLDTTVIAVPTVNPQFAPGFLQETGLKAELSSDADKLKEAFPFGDPPFGVAVENGRQKQSFITFEGDQPEAGLRALGFIE